MSAKFKTLILTLIFIAVGLMSATAQSTESYAQKLEQEREKRFSIGGYGQLDYNQQISSSKSYTGKLEPHRIVLFLGYQFSPKVHFVTELEVEHGNEIYVEQGYLNLRINNKLQFRGGVMLIPMGLTNEYHEPTTYNGVERPTIATIIVPTTWREMGAGIHGRFDEISLNYQAYLFTGFNGYDTQVRLSGKDGLRKGRQKAINSYASSPNVSAKLNYYGINNLSVGLAGYFGKSQSKLFDGLDKSSVNMTSKADSSVVDIAMVGLDAQYRIKGLDIRGEYIHTFVGNTNEYNLYNKKQNDLGSEMQGWYLEVSYDVLYPKLKGERKIVPFVRYESYDTHYKVLGITRNKSYNFNELFAGIGYSPIEGVMLKTDFQWRMNPHDNSLNSKWLNMGIGLTF
jgi:hypothetical protein